VKAASRTRGSTIDKEKKTDLSIGISEIGGRTMYSPILTVQAAPTGVSLVQGGCSEICLQFTRSMRPNSILFI